MDVGVGAGQAAAGGATYGLITAGAIVTVLHCLSRYQVHDYADRDASIGLAGSLIAVVAAVTLVAAAGRIGGRLPGLRRPQWHVFVPLLLVPMAVVPLVLGAERNRVEAALLWGCAAVTVHVLLAYAPVGRSWRRWVSATLVLPCAAATLTTWGCQHRWRAQKFQAVGLPLIVPEVPGYQLTGTWAGRYSIRTALRGPSGRRLYGVVEAASVRYGGCGPGSDRRWRVSSAGDGLERAMSCLRDGTMLTLIPGGGSAGIADVLPHVRLREVDASVLADLPDEPAMSEPD